MKVALLFVPTLFAAGCFLAPAMHLSESAAAQRYAMADPQHPGETLQLKVVAITPALLKRDAPPAATPATPAADITPPIYHYRVGAHDVLTITVWDHPELTIPAGQFRAAEEAGHRVRADGTIFFPYAGVLDVAGKTVEEIRQLLTDKLKAHIERPQLDVRVAGFHSQKAHVIGEVKTPSVLAITDTPMTALEALQQAGGITAEADLERVVLTRGSGREVLNLQALYEAGDLTQDRLLAGGDVVHVPDRNQNRVYVLGEVGVARAPLMHRGRMSLADALSEAGGIDRVTADPGGVYVFRDEAGNPGIYHLDAESPDAMLLAVQFPLKPRDVVFVSSHGLARWNRVVSQILPTIQALWQTATLPTAVINVVEAQR